MPITLKPFTMKDVSLTLIKTDDAGTGIAEEYKCQLTQAQLTPSASTGGGGNELATFCDTFSDAGSTLATWTLDLAGFQAFENVADFTLLSFNEEGNKFNFELIPNGALLAPGPGPSPTAPAFTGQVTMVATQIGGTAASWATFTASLPTVGKPVMVSTAAAF